MGEIAFRLGRCQGSYSSEKVKSTANVMIGSVQKALALSNFSKKLNFSCLQFHSSVRTERSLTMMKTTQLILITVLIAEFGLRAASAPMPSPAFTPRTDINPVLLYWQAFSVLPDLTEKDRAAFYQEPFPATISPEILAVAARFDDTFRLLHRGSDMSAPCDWGFDPADGPNTVYPNLVKMRIIMQACVFRVNAALSQGREADALQDLLATATMNRRSSKNAPLVLQSIQIGIEQTLVELIASTFDQWSPDSLRTLQDRWQNLPEPTTVAQAIATEQTLFFQWVIQKIRSIQKTHGTNNSQSTTEVTRFFGQLLGEESETATALLDSCQNSIDCFLERFESQGKVYRLMEALASADPKTWSDRKNALADSLKDLPLLNLFTPNVARARATEMEHIARLAMLQAALAYRLSENVPNLSFPDPFGQGPLQLRTHADRQGRPTLSISSSLSLPQTEIDASLAFILPEA